MNMRATCGIVAAVSAAVAGLCSVATAQEQSREDLSKTKFDPIALRAPDPTDRFNEIIIDQKLNAQIPLDLRFKDESGRSVVLGEYFTDKPVVLSLVYYECPMLCNLILNGMVTAFDANENKLDIGKDYVVLSVSIDPDETPELAGKKKANYLEQYHREGGSAGWHFLTGDQDAIEDLATAVGYRYYYDTTTNQYAHASGIMILTPQGKISSYYLGIEYFPRNLQLALVDAGQGKIGSLVDQLVLLCYMYDPTKGTYGFYIMSVVRLAGTATALAVVAFWVVNYFRGRRVDDAPGAMLPGAPAGKR
jgi:protein SCO1/2